MALILQSKAFDPGKSIPSEYTCDGNDESPPLHWSGAPDETRSFALICDDPDAPDGIFAHWILYNVPGDMEKLPQDFSSHNIGLEGRNDFGDARYGGPCPPEGSSHRYFFRLFALDEELNISAGATRDQVFDRIQPHILEQTELVGVYSRE